MSWHRTTYFFVAAAAVVFLFRPAHAGPALLFDTSNGQVLYAEDAGQPWYPASLAKLMTAYVVFDAWKTGKVARDSKITISAKANGQPPMRLGRGVGKELTYDEAVAALIMKSANDIAVALAEAVAGSEEAFVAEMNATAQRLGMSGTRYINPNGLPGEGQYTTAKDLAILTQAIVRDFPQHLPVFAMATAQVGKKTIATHNSVLVSIEGGDGMKTGFTCSAGYNIVASATRNGHRLVAVVLGQASNAKRAARTAALLEYGFRMLGWKALFPAPTVESLPEGAYDRELVRMANLEKRFKDCRDPEPAEAPVVASGDPAAGSPPASPVAKGAGVKQAAAAAAKAKLPPKRILKASLKRRVKRPASKAHKAPEFTAAMP
jgi:D-alanyl-D-alanine carboxypeptidase